MKQFFIGASYYPEWWAPERWEEDFAKMEELGFNAVRMGEFAWSWFEPTEGNFCFEPMLQVLDIAQKHGIGVIMGTVTAVCPAWLYKKYPEVKGGNENGHYDFGGRKGQCLSSKIFLEYARRITEEQTKALGNHPAIVGWQLDNEPGFPFRDYDACCREGFQQWLRKKYGTVDELNKAWFTMMWSNVYTSFEEIDIPVNASEGGWTPEVQLDYRRYFSFTFHRLLSMEAKYVRRYSPNRFIYTNWPGANWSVNCFEATEYLDYAAWDNYVPQPNRDNYRVQLRAGMEHSFDRRLSCGKEQFLVAEQHAYTDADTPADAIRAVTWFSVANGAFGTLFFEWRSPTGGAEQAYGSLLDMGGDFREDTKPVLQKLCAELKEHFAALAGTKTPAEVAVLYSYDNSWGTSGWTVDGFYDEEIFNAFGGFKNALGTDVDMASITDDLSKYKIILMPNHRIVTEEQAVKIKEYVQNGGIAVLNTETGTRDMTNQNREAALPGLFAEMCGATEKNFVHASVLRERTGEAAVAFQGKTVGVTGTMHTLRLHGAQPLAVYTSGLLKDTPAVTVHPYGKGFAVLYGTDGNDIFYYEALAKALQNYSGVTPLLSAEDGILLCSRVKEEKKYIFAINMKDTPAAVTLQAPMREVLTQTVLCGTVTVKGYDVLWLEQ